MAKEDKGSMEGLKDLSPEERITKLKEIEEKSKKEIEAAQKLIKQSEEELEERKKFEDKVPIPQLIAQEERGLESKEEKEMFEAQRQKTAGKLPEAAPKKEEKSLEEQLRAEHIEELARKPAEELKQMMANIYQQAGAQNGYMNQEQKAEIYSITKAEQEKIYAMREGQYPKEQMASALENISATFAIGQKLRQMYSTKGEEGGNPDYIRGPY